MTDELNQAHVLLAAYYAMTVAQRRRVALGEWYCPGKTSCPLLTVWQSPLGRIGVVPNYTLPRAENARVSTEEGRRAHTRDGDNHWYGDGHLVDELPKSSNLTLTCKHYRGLIDVTDILEAIEGARPGTPARRVLPRAVGDSR